MLKLIGVPKNLGVDPLPDPVGYFGAPWQPFWIVQDGVVLQVVSECPRHRKSGIEYFFSLELHTWSIKYTSYDETSLFMINKKPD